MNATTMSDRPVYSISELAAEFGVTTRTIRFYEEKGLVAPSRIGRKRVYGPGDYTRLRLVLRGKRLGFTLDESREIIDMYDGVSGKSHQLLTLIDRIRERRTSLLQQMRDIDGVLADLADVERRCFESLSADPQRRSSTESKKGLET